MLTLLALSFEDLRPEADLFFRGEIEVVLGVVPLGFAYAV